jgi:hypothetical protein
MGSMIGRALSVIASDMAGVADFETAPAERWYPDFEADKLKPLGLTAFVLPETSEFQPESRQRRPKQRLAVFAAVVAPILEGTFAEGDAVVEVAELVEAYFYRQQIVESGLSIAVLDCKFEPAMSSDFARQHNIWCSIVKMEVEVQ